MQSFLRNKTSFTEMGLLYRRAILCDETEEVKQGRDVIIFTVGQNRYQSHDMVLDRVGIHAVDLGQDPRQRVISGYDGVDDGLSNGKKVLLEMSSLKILTTIRLTSGKNAG